MTRRVASTLRQYQKRFTNTVLFLVRATGFFTAMVFLLCFPLGNPETMCTVDPLTQQNERMVMPVSLACTVYRTLLSTAKYTSTATREMSEITVIWLYDLFYEAKLKFYRFLTEIDKEDFCRTACCQFDEDDIYLDTNTKLERKDRVKCKCRPKNCKRHSRILSEN